MGEDDSKSMTSVSASFARSPCDCVRFAFGVGEKCEVICPLPRLDRGVDKSGEGRLSPLIFLGVRCDLVSGAKHVIGCDEGSGFSVVTELLLIIELGTRIPGSLKPETGYVSS